MYTPAQPHSAAIWNDGATLAQVSDNIVPVGVVSADPDESQVERVDFVSFLKWIIYTSSAD